MSKAESDLLSRKYVVSVNLGEEVGSQIYAIAETNNIAATVLIRLLLRKALSSRVGSLIDVTLEAVPFGHEKPVLQAALE
jgi:predicted DNA-binding protein with PD1-like motif